MSSPRTWTSLGRTPLNVDFTLPPSPGRGNVASLSDFIRRQSAPIPQVNDDMSSSPIPDLVESYSLDEELAKSGYTPLSKMVIVSPSGEGNVRFIKAQNQLGEPLYIAIDVDDAYISQSNSDTHLRESRVPMNIAQPDKEMAFSKAGLSVAGVALECKNGLCTILHDEQMQAPREQNFVLIHSRQVKETLVVASFPIVRVSEIRSNPQTVQKNVDCALRKMRNAALTNCLCHIEAVKKKFNQTCRLFQETLDAKEKVIREFHRTMVFLEDNFDKCMKCPEKNHEKLQTIVYNMEKRNAKFTHLMESCQEIASLEATLDNTLITLKEAKCKLEKKFRHLHCVYELKHKKGCCHRCVWDKEEEDSESEVEE